jgi:predicted metal-dependent phosphoesterase TrpH
VALNVSELIPRGLSAAESVERIHKAGGVAIACHPHVLFKGCLKGNVCEAFDAIEIINARAFPFIRSVKKAAQTAERLHLSQVAGTDAHYGPQIGYSYTLIETSEPTVDAIMEAIVQGRCQPRGRAAPTHLEHHAGIPKAKRMAKI